MKLNTPILKISDDGKKNIFKKNIQLTKDDYKNLNDFLKNKRLKINISEISDENEKNNIMFYFSFDNYNNARFDVFSPYGKGQTNETKEENSKLNDQIMSFKNFGFNMTLSKIFNAVNGRADDPWSRVLFDKNYIVGELKFDDSEENKLDSLTLPEQERKNSLIDTKRKICFLNFLLDQPFIDKNKLIKEKEIDSIDLNAKSGKIEEEKVLRFDLDPKFSNRNSDQDDVNLKKSQEKDIPHNDNKTDLKNLKFKINCIIEFLVRLIKWVFIDQEKFNNTYENEKDFSKLKKTIEDSNDNFIKKLSYKIAFNDLIDFSIEKSCDVNR